MINGKLIQEHDPIFSASASAGITSTDITNWNNKSDFSGSYNDLSNKPTIPSMETSRGTSTANGYAQSYINGLTTYSTSEKRIGTWTDGKPIYRKTFVGSYNNNATLVSNVKVLTNAYGMVRISSVERAFPYFEYYNDSDVYQGTVQLNDSHQVKTVFTSGNDSVSANINLTLEYTKTTD